MTGSVTGGNSVANTISVAGSNFSFSGSANFNPLFPDPATGCSILQSTCTTNFSSTFSYSSNAPNGPAQINSVVVNGTTYTPGTLPFGYVLTVNMVFVSAPATTNADITFNGPVPELWLASWNNVPFTMTGSILLTGPSRDSQGNPIPVVTILSESLTGSGGFTAFSEQSAIRAGSYSVTAAFANVPEPSTVMLTGLALLLVPVASKLRRR